MIHCGDIQILLNDKPPDSPSAPDVWKCVADVLEADGKLSGPFRLYDMKVTGTKIHDILVKQSADSFNVEGGGYEISGGSHRIYATLKDGQAEWDQWVALLAASCSLVMGISFDTDYYRWQNEDSPEQYNLAGRSHAHLPKYLDSTFPFDRTVIDTSVNAGHRSIRTFYKCGVQDDLSPQECKKLPPGDAYYEAVGAVMWLGESFFTRTGADESAVRAADWLEVTDFAPGILRVQAQETCFTSDTGPEAELQWRLRDLLFPRKFPSPAEGYEPVP